MTERHPTPDKRRNWLPCGCLILMFLVCIFMPVAGFVGWSFRASRQVEVQLAQIRHAGLPTDPDEMNQFYQIDSRFEDATQLYLAAQNEFSGNAFDADCRNLPIVGISEAEIPPPGQPWAEQAAVEAFLAKYDDGLQSLHQAVAMGGVARFPMAFEDGFSMLLPQAQSMRMCARMLVLEAHVKAHQGDAEGAADAILAMSTVTRSLENQPILVSQLVRVAIQGMAINLTSEMLPHVEFSDKDLVRFQKAFRRDDFKVGLAHGLVGERVLGAEAFKNPAGVMGNDASPASRLVRGSNEDLAYFLKVHIDLRDAVLMEYPETFEAVEGTFDEMKDKIATPFGRMRYVLSGMTLPAVEACIDAAGRADGANRCIDAAIAVERYRRRNGSLPSSLEKLVPDYLSAVPMDPFDGQPIRYIIKNDCYLLYNCGRNRTDEGGVIDDQRTDNVIRIELKSGKNETAEPAEPAPAETTPTADSAEIQG